MSPLGDAAATRSLPALSGELGRFGQQDLPANDDDRVYEPYAVEAAESHL
jgi:hypothetical protein